MKNTLTSNKPLYFYSKTISARARIFRILLLMLWCTVKDNRHDLGVNEGQGMYWQGMDNSHGLYGPPDEGPRHLVEGVTHDCIARRA